MFTSTDHVFQEGNYADLDSDGQLNGHLISDSEFKATGGPAVFAQTPFLRPPVPVTVDSASNAWQKVVADAGCSLHRDTVDQSIVAELKSLGKNGRLITVESEHEIKATAEK
jgi:hypothetical protein